MTLVRGTLRTSPTPRWPDESWKRRAPYGGGMTSTGSPEARTTASATLPTTQRLIPLRPCVASTIRSWGSSWARCTSSKQVGQKGSL